MISLNKVSNSGFFDDFVEGGEETERAEGVEGASKSRSTCGQH